MRIDLPDCPGAGERWINKDFSFMQIRGAFLVVESEGLCEMRDTLESPWEEKETSLRWMFKLSRIDSVDLTWSRMDKCYALFVDSTCITRCATKKEGKEYQRFITEAILSSKY